MHARPLLPATIFLLIATHAAAQPLGTGGGDFPTPETDCIPPGARQAIRIAAERFRAAPPPSTMVPLYMDPMSGGGMNSFGKTVINYVDLDPTTSVKDWNCLGATYDGHLGTDIEIPSFWHMDEGIPILAAAAGQVTYVHDGEFDRRTAWQSGAVANGVVVSHLDGSFGYYWHMRKGSVRVNVGDAVVTGQVLGMVGSSGFSSGPHLHFETYANGTVDPFAGPCRAGSSYWQVQQAHVSTLPFQLFGHGLTTIPIDWPTVLEWPPTKTHVKNTTKIYSWIRVRNIRTTDQMKWRLIQNGAASDSFSFNPSGNYASSWWYVSWNLGSGNGNFSFDIQRNGVSIAQQPFTVNNVVNAPPVVARTVHVIPMNGTLEAAIGSSDPDGAIFGHEVTTPPAHGTVVLFGGYQKNFRYTPNPGFTGVDGFFVRARDDENLWGTPQWIPIGVGNVTAADETPAPGLAMVVAPNPVTSESAVDFALPTAADATLELFDVSGHRVRTLASGPFAAGPHHVTFRTTHGGRRLNPGIYFMSLTTGGSRLSRRLVVAL